jgi:2-polyprenyl-3-methyl-5-hydroxy-6-metoxy-1,4-benzoquinol methylase
VLARARSVLRTQWARAALRGVHFSDRHERLDALYRIRDPWGMESDAQAFRFRETNRIIGEQFGHVGRVLEVGCGEGHQSQELLRICDELVGIDVSRRAVERARLRCPQATFAVGAITDDVVPGGRFDLVLGCEVLYYMRDVAAALARFSELGSACLVTYYEQPAKELDRYVLAIPGVESTRVTYGDSGWTVAWWTSRA